MGETTDVDVFEDNGIIMLRYPDGSVESYDDYMRRTEPGMQYDNATGELIVATPATAEDAARPARPKPDVFGDTTMEMAAPYFKEASAAWNAPARPTYFTDPVLGSLEQFGQGLGNAGLAGLNAALGGVYGGIGLLSEIVPQSRENEKLLAADLAGMFESAGPAPEGRMLGALSDAGAARAVGRDVVDRLNQRGPMPTTYSNPIPGLMIGQHNLSPVGVKVASEIGGIPMPSLAIARANAPLEKFGDVTLLAQPEMVLPSRNVNVWPNDAYTGRQPRGDVQFSNETTARAALKENPDFGHMRDATYWMDATNSIADADEMMKTAQLGVAEGIDPKKYSSMWDYVRDVRAKLGYQAYEDAPKMPGFEAYVDMERVLYPKELFTQSGNRKKPQPYTLDAVMKRMGSDKAYMAGSEGWDYGPGSFRAQVTPQFKTAAQVKSARGLLASGNEFEPIASAFRDAYGTIKGDIEQYAKNSRLVYEAPEAMTEIGRGGSANWFGDVPSEVRGYVEDLARTARTMPTEYFEAKPKVAYSLADFPAALVPESAPQTADILRRAGVKDVLTYGPGTARAELIQRFPQLLFSAAGTGFPLGILAMQPDQEQY